MRACCDIHIACALIVCMSGIQHITALPRHTTTRILCRHVPYIHYTDSKDKNFTTVNSTAHTCKAEKPGLPPKICSQSLGTAIGWQVLLACSVMACRRTLTPAAQNLLSRTSMVARFSRKIKAPQSLVATNVCNPRWLRSRCVMPGNPGVAWWYPRKFVQETPPAMPAV